MSQYTFLFFCTPFYIVLFVVAIFSLFFFFFLKGRGAGGGGREGRGEQDDRGLKKNDFLYFYYVF